MGSNLDAPVHQAAQVVPGHGSQLLRICTGFGGKLGNREGPPIVGVVRTGKHRDRNVKPLQKGQRDGDASVGIVECHVEQPSATVQRLHERNRLVATVEEDANLAFKRIWPDRQRIVPCFGDGVVAEHEWTRQKRAPILEFRRRETSQVDHAVLCAKGVFRNDRGAHALPAFVFARAKLSSLVYLRDGRQRDERSEHER